MRDRRRLKGRIAYLDGRGETTGRELFSISVHGDGSRTLRAQCEMDNDALVRDAVLALDARLRPVEAFVRIVEGGEWRGSGHYRIGDGQARATLAAPEGDRAAQAESRPEFFGTHAVINDGWLALLGGALADGESAALAGLTCSHQANGGGAPALLASAVTLTRLGAELLQVAAGHFQCVHWTVTYGGHTPIDIWTTGEDQVLALMTWDHLDGRYELVELR